MLSLLQELAENRELACVYREGDPPGSFCVGWIVAADEDFTLIYAVTPDGLFDGYWIQETDVIVRIDTSNRYLESIKRLLPAALPPMMNVPDGYDDLLLIFLDYAVQNRAFASFSLGNASAYDVNGFVLEFPDNLCRMLLVDEYGYPDGISTFPIDMITRGECASRAGRTTQKLYDGLVKGGT